MRVLRALSRLSRSETLVAGAAALLTETLERSRQVSNRCRASERPRDGRLAAPLLCSALHSPLWPLESCRQRTPRSRSVAARSDGARGSRSAAHCRATREVSRAGGGWCSSARDVCGLLIRAPPAASRNALSRRVASLSAHLLTPALCAMSCDERAMNAAKRSAQLLSAHWFPHSQ